MAPRFLAFRASGWWCHLLKWERVEDCHVWGTWDGCVGLGLRGEVCGLGGAGKLVAMADRWGTPSRSTVVQPYSWPLLIGVGKREGPGEEEKALGPTTQN